MQKIKCDICQRLISQSFINKHKNVCLSLIKNKEFLINSYPKLSLLKLSKILGIDGRAISIFLKNNGVKVRSDENGQYFIHNNVDENYFNVIDSHEKAWVLGILGADGFIGSNGKMLGLSQSGDRGRKLVEYFKNALKINNPIRVGKTTHQDAHSIIISNKNIIEDLKKYNIIQNKSYMYAFPDLLPNQYLNSFIRGYIDGDGCINYYNNGNGCMNLHVSFVGPPLFIKKCLAKIPIQGGNIYPCSGSDKVLEITWYGEKAIKFCDWIFSERNLYEGYKLDNYNKYLKYRKDNPTKRDKYAPLKNKAIELLKQKINPMKISP